ncbi:MAG TPA: poly-beta-1,6-N-acetyl-D-glucosamine biosynthesis protein PgaD [Burkholderiaceae bacterium]|jgi:poly-beta-1,6-N-acetyl-D-glucosamine biosynthesis protein PgaD|nr:poly-beta-1,6-N-acetyl-D-glucosamine biosynthesis protein PgaD [Burkholderiaceae bacterium]
MNPKDSPGIDILQSAWLRARDDSEPLDEEERSLLLEVSRRARAPLIIERPDSVLSARKLTNYLLTFVWWSVWGHFMLPLLTLLLWMSGFRRFSDQLLGRAGLDALVSRLPLYSAVVGVLCSGLIAWALLNWWRFADRNRRRSVKPVSAAEVARTYGLTAADLARWQQTRRLVVVHDPNGQPIDVVPAFALRASAGEAAVAASTTKTGGPARRSPQGEAG